MSGEALLRVCSITKRFPGVTALDRVSFDLRAGEVHALCGENGAGKSTLIKILSGVHPAGSYEGEIIIDNKAVAFSSISEAAEAGIAVIHQELALIAEMTVAENVFLGNEPRRGPFIDRLELYARTRELIERYGLQLDPSARVQDLGIAGQQLVEILKALSKRSRILLLDEPTAALTEAEVDVLLDIVRTLKNMGITCVYISHKLDEVFAIADRITVLRDGASIATLETAETDKQSVIRHMVGREIREFFPHHSKPTGAAVFAVEDLHVSTTGPAKIGLQEISFEVHAGEVLGLGGLMGAGRTELLMHIFGVFGTRLRGRILLHGKPYTGSSPEQAIEAGIVLVSEDRKRYGLHLDKSIGFNLSLASLQQFTRGGLIDHAREIHRNQHFFDTLGIRAPGQRALVSSLSGGNQQKVVLGKALMTGPEVIFLDEPTRGIDVGAKVEVYELINELTDQGKAVVLVSSELPELMGMSDRMIILSQGRIGGEFLRGEATQEKILTAAMRFH